MADAGGTLLPTPSATRVSPSDHQLEQLWNAHANTPPRGGQVADNRKEPGGPGGDRPRRSSVCRFGMIVATILTFRLVCAILWAKSARLRRADEVEGG